MMVDSEDECDSWRSRDKYPKERQEVRTSPSPMEQRNEKRSFNSYQSPMKSSEPPFKKQKRENDDYCNFNVNPRENRRDTSFESRNSVKTSEETPNYPTQPPMLLFKHFLQQQDDDIEMEEAMKKYNEYKVGFVKKQLKAFFDAHNSQEWFKEKYLPLFVEQRKTDTSKNIQMRKEIFNFLFDNVWIDNVKIDNDESDAIIRLMDAVVILLEGGNANDLKILDSRRYRSESPNDPKVVKSHNSSEIDMEKEKNEDEPNDIEGDKEKESVEVTDETVSDVVEKEDTVEKSISQPTITEQEPRALHKTFSIFLRNLHPNVLRSEIEALVKPYAGFLRLALQDPTPDRKFFRRGWVTYDCTVNIKEICWNLNNIRLHDCDIGAIVNRELTQRIRPISVLANHKAVMRQDLKFAARFVAKFDKRHSIWQRSSNESSDNLLSSDNPLLKDITEHLVDEGSYEEEALLGGNINCNLEACSGDSSHINIETDQKIANVLDKLILYLRFVHSFDYYSLTEYQIEDEMPHRCGIIHVRGNHVNPDKQLTQKDVEEYMKSFEQKAQGILNSVDVLNLDDARKLGYVEIDEAVEAYILENTQKITDEKWLCPLSGKKFKGPDFVRKHILNKHLDKVDLVKQNSQFFNNYLLDPKRPQLPEHPNNRPGAKPVLDSRDEMRETDNVNKFRNDDRNRNMDSSRPSGRRTDDFDRRNSYKNERSSPNYRNSFDNRGGSGSYYRKGNFQNRGNSGKQRNGGGSYYNRKMLSYNDLDAPADD